MCTFSRRILAGILVAVFSASSIEAAAANPISPKPRPMQMRQLYAMKLRDGSDARIYDNGLVITTKTAKNTGKTTQRVFELPVHPETDTPLGRETAEVNRSQVQQAYDRRPQRPYAPGRLVVVFQPSVIGARPSLLLDSVDVARLHEKHVVAMVPRYTNDSQVNAALGSLGVWRMERLFRKIDGGTLESMRARAEYKLHHPVLDIANAYTIQLSNATVPAAIEKLRKLPQVAYASPDWSVTTMNTGGIHLNPQNPAFALKRLHENPAGELFHSNFSAPVVPTNYALQSSEQSMLNASGVNAVTAYDEIERTFHQLPGTGVTVTNVSIGDIMDASDATSRCAYYETGNGPTTVMQGGQRYLDLPTMPLIPVYTADASGNLGEQSVCGTGDPFLGEIGLDFSVMAPLPDGRQRGGSMGSGGSDLLGIAPGASYRLIVPANSQPTLTDIDTALLAASQQLPKPDVITASLGIGADSYGFPGRYLGDDPLSSALMSAISSQYDIVLCVSANDGTRTSTFVPIGPSGGAAPTNVATSPASVTSAGDDAFSTTPSYDYDSGNIVAGATTLDDIFSAQPQNTGLPPALRNQQTFAETRWNGFTVFASGFGSLVSLSAPGDNIVMFEHTIGGSASDAGMYINGGTSASAPEIAAGAAVAIGVARLVAKPFASATAVRSFLAQTGTTVAAVPQSDVNNNVGPQLNLGRAVESLLTKNGHLLQPQAIRVGIAQRRNLTELDGVFVSDTDPGNIDLEGPVSSIDGAQTGGNQNALITIAPDWEAIPSNARYELIVSGRPKDVLATTSYARLFPRQILAAAGMPLVGSSERTVKLTYRARLGFRVVAQSSFSLTFGPAGSTARAAMAPIVAPVTRGATIDVSYDLTNVRNVSSPTLLVSEPGRFNPYSGEIFHPSYTAPLGQLKGTVAIPVSKLQGGGVYGIGIQFGTLASVPLYSDFAYTRVDDGSTARPPAPLVGPSGYGALLGHYAELPWNQPYRISWDVKNVSGATGAVLEVSTDGPNNHGSYTFNSFNNPNGSERDDNGVDTGSVFYKPLPATAGSHVFTPAELGLVPTYYENIRVLAVNGYGKVVGEAGDISTVREDGVVPNDGSLLPPVAPNVWAITTNGTEGYFAGNVNIASEGYGVIETSVESFDQRTNAVTGTDAWNYGHQYYQLPTGVLYGSDVGMYIPFSCDGSIPDVPPYGPCPGTLNPFPQSIIISSIANGTIGPAWVMPAQWNFSSGAANPTNDEAVVQTYQQTGPPDVMIAMSDLAANTLGSTFDVNQSMAPCGYCAWPPGAQNISAMPQYNPAQNYVVLAAFNEGSPVLAVVNTSTGSTVQIPAASGGGPPASLPGSGFPQATALDTSNNEVIVAPMFTGVASIWNVQTGTQVGPNIQLGQAPPGSCCGQPNLEKFAAADSVNHLFLVEQDVTADLFVDDNNAHSYLYEIDANGNIVKINKTMALLPAASSSPANNMQINPALRQGYVESPDFTQLMPFSY